MITLATSSVVIVFVKERFHNAVESDILGIFYVFIVTNLAPPPKKKIASAPLTCVKAVIVYWFVD